MPFKLNALTGELDVVSIEDNNFSFNNIITTESVTIPEYQQMIVYGDLVNDGELIINGELVLIDGKVHNRIIDTAIDETINLDVYELIRQTESEIVTSFTATTGSMITVTNRSGADNILNITIQGIASPTIKDRESFSLIYNGTDYDFA